MYKSFPNNLPNTVQVKYIKNIQGKVLEMKKYSIIK